MSQPTSPAGPPSSAPEASPLDVPVTLTVELGRVNLTLSRLADLKPGDVIELSRHSRAPIELTSNGRLVARGDRGGPPGVEAEVDRFDAEVEEVVGTHEVRSHHHRPTPPVRSAAREAECGERTTRAAALRVYPISGGIAVVREGNFP